MAPPLVVIISLKWQKGCCLELKFNQPTDERDSLPQGVDIVAQGSRVHLGSDSTHAHCNTLSTAVLNPHLRQQPTLKAAAAAGSTYLRFQKEEWQAVMATDRHSSQPHHFGVGLNLPRQGWQKQSNPPSYHSYASALEKIAFFLQKITDFCGHIFLRNLFK